MEKKLIVENKKEEKKKPSPLQMQSMLLRRKRLDNEPDLVKLTVEDIKNEISEEASEIFLNHPEIQKVLDLNPVIQRLAINRVLISTLLMFRAITNINVTEVIIYISFDINPALWRTSLMENVYPFLKENKVLETVYGGNK